MSKKKRNKRLLKKEFITDEASKKLDEVLASEIRESKKKDLEENKALIEQLDHLEQILFRTS